MPDDDVNEVDLEQQNVGPSSEAGGGEWPDPDGPPTGPASGEVPDRGGDPVAGAGTDTQAEWQQDGTSGGDRGEARLGGGPSGFKDVLEADPVVGGASSTPHDDDPRDRRDSPDPSTGGP